MLGKLAFSLIVCPAKRVQGSTGESQSPPTIASGTAVLWLVLTQVTEQGSDCTGLLPQNILVPQVSVINLLIRQPSKKKDTIN